MTSSKWFIRFRDDGEIFYCHSPFESKYDAIDSILRLHPLAEIISVVPLFEIKEF